MSHCQSQSCCCSKSCGCGCRSGSSGCGSQQDSCHEEGASQSCDFSKKLLGLADEAWMEVLKEKIKDHIKKNDQKLDEIARIVSEANHARWHAKCAAKQHCSSYESQLKELFHPSGNSCQR